LEQIPFSVYAKELFTFVFLFFFVDVILVGFDELLGKSVIGAKGNYIGDICGGDIEYSTWKITHLQVKLSNIAAKEIGVKKAFKKPTVRIPTSLIDKIGVIITLNQSVFDLKENQDVSINSTSNINRLYRMNKGVEGEKKWILNKEE
jgi:sporulation protein YlmC with PRC-barrel domain